MRLIVRLTRQKFNERNAKIGLEVKGQGQNVSSKYYFERYRNRYFDQVPGIYEHWFLSYMLPLFGCRDLDLGPMTLKLNHDLDILKMHHHIENEVAR